MADKFTEPSFVRRLGPWAPALETVSFAAKVRSPSIEVELFAIMWTWESILGTCCLLSVILLSGGMGGVLARRLAVPGDGEDPSEAAFFRT